MKLPYELKKQSKIGREMDKSGSQHRPLAGKFQPNQIQASKKVASKIALLAKKIGQKKADSEVACGPKNVYPNLT